MKYFKLLIFMALLHSVAVSQDCRFVVTCDMREYSGAGFFDTSDYFRGTCEAIARVGKGDFMISPGDIDPPADVYYTISTYLGADYLWYPCIGNHESETPADMDWLETFCTGLTNVINWGPASCPLTTYSFEWGKIHFAVINEYCDEFSNTGADGDVTDTIYDWLRADLERNTKPLVFVIGHEPAYPKHDVDCGRIRNVRASLDRNPANRDRFWQLLKEFGVLAYLCGHSHGYSAVEIDGVWQIDAGHCRGAGDTGAPSTFVTIEVKGQTVEMMAFRDTHDGQYDYFDVVHTEYLARDWEAPAAPTGVRVVGRDE